MNGQNNKSYKGSKIVRSLNTLIDSLVLFLLIILLLFAFYSLWDSKQVYQSADREQFEMYKPKKEKSYSFKELQIMNPDVLGWITLYGTGIDYPMVQGKDNEKYLSRNPAGEVSGSGSIYLDYRCSGDFTDFNTIVYGHHMDRHAMFGDLDKFLDKKFFSSHKYGNIYFDGKNYGIEIFAMDEVDAYDSYIYTPKVKDRERYISYVKSHAVNYRNVNIGPTDRILVLSTCSADITNGRFVLVGKITDETFKNPFPEDEKNRGIGLKARELGDKLYKLPIWLWIVIFIAILVLLKLDIKRLEKRRNT